MKFKEERCECGLDLTTAEPVRVEGIDEETVTGNCPNCQRRHFLESEPTVRGTRRRIFEPEAEPAAPEPEP